MADPVLYKPVYYPGCVCIPDFFEITEEDWEAYERDMAQMREEYERLVFGDELESPV